MPPFCPAARAPRRARPVLLAASLAMLAFSPLPSAASEIAQPIPRVAGGEKLFPIGAPEALADALSDDGQSAAAALVGVSSAGDRFAADRMITGSIAPASTRAWAAGHVPADRHILLGTMLLAVAMMASTAFGLWRWQLRGWSREA
ncbi:hypothetical protein BJF93_11615 [Xaviernesmea oryzae]|uniref:Transmembrane protein n=1 Tax=Xaviernesmea oryzae TaxID=464029 RepID=A0A1Q9AV91_9HYPH|nr:hypothetical protein [Xaviernesmea oryzae]OLP59370.1 hypothetical protein BJF93_11615 [Xaviernesmea oryzae]SEL62727.1 hypothetical protein SAMN04487976_110147 [Xaviernesmea oryzae]